MSLNFPYWWPKFALSHKWLCSFARLQLTFAPAEGGLLRGYERSPDVSEQRSTCETKPKVDVTLYTGTFRVENWDDLRVYSVWPEPLYCSENIKYMPLFKHKMVLKSTWTCCHWICVTYNFQNVHFPGNSAQYSPAWISVKMYFFF